MTPLKEGGHTQAAQSEEQSMFRCRLEADGEEEKKKSEIERGIKQEIKSAIKKEGKSTNELGTMQRADLSSPSLPDLSFVF